MAKQVYECNWAPSQVTETQLNNLVLTGALSSKNAIHWRVPGKECPPTPRDGEVVVFADHLARGFNPPSSRFYRDVLADFQLHPQDIGPNSVTNICHFQVLCEVYFQEEPTVELFRDFFHLNRRTEFTDGPNMELGGMVIQKRKEVTYPHAKLHSHPQGWNNSWFYCKDTPPAEENPLPGLHPERLSNTHPFPQRLTGKERSKYAPQLSKLRAFLANGLTGVDLARCRISWSILPLSRRSGLMCEYTGSVDDPLRHVNIQLTDEEVTEAVKKILNEPEHVCARTGLLPFCTTNKPPAVSLHFSFVLALMLLYLSITDADICLMQGNDPFWSKKITQEKTDKPDRPIRPKTKVIKKSAHKRRTTASSDP